MQLEYNNEGRITKYKQFPSGKIGSICSQHDVDYALAKTLKDKHIADQKMIDSINKLPYKERQWGIFLVQNIILGKKKLGLGAENSNKILSEELHKPKRKNFPRRKIIVNHIDEIFAADLVEMQKFAKLNKGYRYLLMCIDRFSNYSFVIPLKDTIFYDIIDDLVNEYNNKYHSTIKMTPIEGSKKINEKKKKYL